jgi:hypothetical protein
VADNCLQFSEAIPKLKKREEAWLKAQLQHVAVFGDKEFTIDPVPDDSPERYPDLSDFVPAELAERDPDWYGVRFLRDQEGYDPEYDLLGFQYSFDGPEMPRRRNDRWGRHLWLYADEYGNPENVAHLVQKFLKMFRPDQCWSLTYATSCSKPRVSEFGGGAVFVTADEIRWQNAYEFVEQQSAAFKQNGKPQQGETSHGETIATKP